MQTAVEGIGSGALQVLASSSPIDVALAALLNDLDGLSTDLVLVLDEYHLVEPPEVHDRMTFLLGHQPPSCTSYLPPASIRRCPWRRCARGVDWSRCGPPTCDLPPRRPRHTSAARWAWA